MAGRPGTPAGATAEDAVSGGVGQVDTLLAAAQVTKRFGQVTVLGEVSFAVGAGQAIAVVGANGSGKTTLLRCLVGAIRPDSGEVTFAGRRLSETDPAFRAAVASVLDDVEFFPDLSVAEHLSLLAYAHGGTAAGVVEEVLVELDLARVRDQLPPTLSSGQRRRMALASCFVRPRRLLVLDEPEQRLDAAGRRWLIERLSREKTDGTAVVFASHDEEIVREVADLHVRLIR
jgi:ABC-2 type transport system ATP-binding protein